MAEETRTNKASNGHKASEGKPRTEFHQVAKEWEASSLAPKAAEKAVDEFLAAVPLNANSTVIELGCRSGLCTELIARKVGAVLGLDTSKGLIKQFEARADHLKLLDKMAAVRMELRDPKQLEDYLPDDKGFNAAFSHRAVHQLSDFAAALKALVRVLRPGGWLFVTDIESRGDQEAETNHKESTLREGLSIAELYQGLVAAGLTEVSVQRSFTLDAQSTDPETKLAWYIRGLGRKPRKF